MRDRHEVILDERKWWERLIGHPRYRLTLHPAGHPGEALSVESGSRRKAWEHLTAIAALFYGISDLPDPPATVSEDISRRAGQHDDEHTVVRMWR